MTPEFSRACRIDTLGEGVRVVTIEADADERTALAQRFGLIALDSLSADASLSRQGDIILAEGRLAARVVQPCVASGQPVPATLTESFKLRFVPKLAAGSDADEIELSEEDCDTVDYTGGAIDLGEAVAETMALSLDPFPRAPDADEVLKAAGILSEEEAGPFAALKALKDKLG